MNHLVTSAWCRACGPLTPTPAQARHPETAADKAAEAHTKATGHSTVVRGEMKR